MLAGQAGHEATVKALVEAKANLELQDKVGQVAGWHGTCGTKRSLGTHVVGFGHHDSSALDPLLAGHARGMRNNG